MMFDLKTRRLRRRRTAARREVLAKLDTECEARGWRIGQLIDNVSADPYYVTDEKLGEVLDRLRESREAG